MMKGLGATLAKPASFGLALAVFAAFVALVLPGKAADAAAYTPAGANFDTSFFYSPAQAIERAAAYSAAGRGAYIYDRWTFDLAWPAAYGFFMLSSWAFGLRLLAGARAKAPNYRALALPALGVAFDLAENTAVTALMVGTGMAAGSVPPIWLAAAAASVATAMKWLFVGTGLLGALVLPAAGAARLLIASRRGSAEGGRAR